MNFKPTSGLVEDPLWPFPKTHMASLCGLNIISMETAWGICIPDSFRPRSGLLWSMFDEEPWIDLLFLPNRLMANLI